MSDNNGNSGFESAEAFSRMWMEMAGAMMNAAAPQPTGPTGVTPESVRQMRSVMFKAMSSYCDQFMRSKEFLEMMKQSLNNAVAFRQQLNEMMAQTQHNWQSAGQDDVDHLLVMLRRTEERLTGSLENVARTLENLDKRIGALSSRLDKLEGRQATVSSPSRAVAQKTAATKATTKKKAVNKKSAKKKSSRK